MSEKPYELPLDVRMLKVGSLKKATIVDHNNICIAGSISLVDDMVDKVYDQYGAIVTAVNAYPALVAENAELKAENEWMESIIKKIKEEKDRLHFLDNIGGKQKNLYEALEYIINEFIDPAVERGGAQ